MRNSVVHSFTDLLFGTAAADGDPVKGRRRTMTATTANIDSLCALVQRNLYFGRSLRVVVLLLIRVLVLAPSTTLLSTT